MQKRISFIGAGNRGGAILGGILRAGIAEPSQIMAADVLEEKRKETAQTYGVLVTGDNREAAARAEILFLAVKPVFLPGVIEEIRDVIPAGCVVVSIVAGQTIGRLEEMIGHPVKLIRVMPNTPALVGEGMSALTKNALMEKPGMEQEAEEILRIFTSFGKAEWVPERLMDCVTGVSGSAPAFIFQLIEAMADAAVLEGMPRAQSYTFAAQTVLGSAKMVLELGKHPAQLKDMVTSPGGTTIEGCKVLEQQGFRGAMMDAIHAACEKSRKL
ncbi:MAG: pyrroline-5-carboxylate reductase [Lachnospiraceae bacterium]|nr:pyrroline-5-carboxylate reductase [Lachnospiraceae bacterium]